MSDRQQWTDDDERQYRREVWARPLGWLDVLLPERFREPHKSQLGPQSLPRRATRAPSAPAAPDEPQPESDRDATCAAG